MDPIYGAGGVEYLSEAKDVRLVGREHLSDALVQFDQMVPSVGICRICWVR